MPQEVKKVSKKCPEGKVLNPKTGRCIKKHICLDNDIIRCFNGREGI